jgi:hypothetical protein
MKVQVEIFAIRMDEAMAAQMLPNLRESCTWNETPEGALVSHTSKALPRNVISRASDTDQRCIVIKSALILISCQIHSIKFPWHPYCTLTGTQLQWLVFPLRLNQNSARGRRPWMVRVEGGWGGGWGVRWDGAHSTRGEMLKYGEVLEASLTTSVSLF